MDNRHKDNSIIRYTAVYSLLIAAFIVFSYIPFIFFSKNHVALNYFLQAQITKWKNTNSKYQNNVGFIDFENRLFLHELPNADYSKGGVYFVGASNVKNSIMTWDIPLKYRNYIKNYGISSANYKQQYQFVKYLVEEEHLLSAGPDKTLIVFGLFYGAAVPKKGRPNEFYFENLLKRYNLYYYDSDEGIKKVRSSSLFHTYKLEKARLINFLHFLKSYLDFPTREPGYIHTKQKYMEYWDKIMGTDWMIDVDIQVMKILKTIEYLKARKVNILFIITPLGTWHKKRPYAKYFYKKISDLSKSKNVPLIDLSALLNDDEYYDSSHANYSGQIKIHDYFLGLAIDHLCKKGVVSDCNN